MEGLGKGKPSHKIALVQYLHFRYLKFLVKSEKSLKSQVFHDMVFCGRNISIPFFSPKLKILLGAEPYRLCQILGMDKWLAQAPKVWR